MIIINRSKAEQMVRDRLRFERAARLSELDVAYMRALELGEDATGIVEEKQTLRDVTDKDLSGLSLVELSTLTLDRAVEL